MTHDTPHVCIPLEEIASVIGGPLDPQRLHDYATTITGARQTAAALVGLIADHMPTPPMDEPTHTGALVADNDGGLWARCTDGRWVSLTFSGGRTLWVNLLDGFGPLTPAEVAQ